MTTALPDGFVAPIDDLRGIFGLFCLPLPHLSQRSQSCNVMTNIGGCHVPQKPDNRVIKKGSLQ